MIDSTISDETEPSAPDAGGSKVYANASSLAIQGEMPAVGDSVDLQVQGTVASVEGDVVCVTPVTVNGQPAPSGASEPPVNEHDKLMSMAGADDANY